MAKNTTLGKTIESLKERLAKDPFSRAFLQLAEEYRKLGQFDEATEVCLEGLKRHPAYLPARIALGRTYLESGNLDLAHQTLAEVHRTMPENHLAGKLLAEVQRRTGHPREAADTYRAMLRHSPGDREVEALLKDLQEPPLPPAVVEIPILRPPAPAAGDPLLDPALDYRPEDIGPAAGGGSLSGGPPASIKGWARTASPNPAPPGPAATIAPPPMKPEPTPEAVPHRWAGAQSWPEPPEEAVPEGGAEAEEESDALQTNTLAELYLRQGLIERALEVYRAMLRLDPANERLRHRLEELASNGTPPGTNGSQPEVPRQTAPRETENRPGEVRENQALFSAAAPSFDAPGALPEPEVTAVPPPATTWEPPAPAAGPPPGVLALQRWLRTIRNGAGAAAGEARDR